MLSAKCRKCSALPIVYSDKVTRTHGDHLRENLLTRTSLINFPAESERRKRFELTRCDRASGSSTVGRLSTSVRVSVVAVARAGGGGTLLV